MTGELVGVLLALTLAAATPLWQGPNLFLSSMARNIRHLPCVSRRTGESGTCMFAFSCAKLNGTHLGTCIDRFYFGSCCKVPEEIPGSGGDIDPVPPIEDNSLEGATTSRIRPAVTQKPQITTPAFSTPRPSSQGLVSSGVSSASTTFGTGVTGVPATFTKPSTLRPSSQRPVGVTQSSSTQGFGSTSGLGSSSGTSAGGISITPESGSTLAYGPDASSTQVPSRFNTTSSSKPTISTPVLLSFPQPTTAPPTFVTWTTIEEATGKPPPISPRPQVSAVSGGTHRPTQLSSTGLPTTERPTMTSTIVLPVSTVRPSVSSPRPPPSTHRPSSSTPQLPSTSRPSNITKPASSPSRPTVVTKPPAPVSTPTAGPSSHRPPTNTPKPVQQKPTKPASKPKPPSKPKPTSKPVSAKPSSKPPTTTTTTTSQPTISETWVPVSVSTHAPSTALLTDKPVKNSTMSGPSTPGVPTSSVALPSVMSTASPTPHPVSAVFESLNISNYREVCGRRLFPESRVVGGDKSTFGKWPWQISLRQWRTSTYLHKCGAALLNENWAITAAHCVENVPPSDLLLRLGEHDLSIEDEPFGYQERRVQIVASHPQFDPRTFEYDLALLRFYEPVVFQPNIIPICVPEDDTHFVGSNAFVTGWGRLYEDGPLPSVLQEVSVPVINNSLCETMYRAAGYIEHIPDIFICAGWKKGGFDSCEGDSGGPMVIQRPDKRWLLAGVISWGIGCAEPNQPGVYTRISQFRHWINQILQF